RRDRRGGGVDRGPAAGLPRGERPQLAGDDLPAGHRRARRRRRRRVDGGVSPGGRRGGTVKGGVLLGSRSDRGRMAPALDILAEFEVEATEHVMSAHRAPEVVAGFARSARDEGYGVLVCGAGMAAHLAGAVAGHTTLPVIGVPLSGGPLSGVDALYATVQMPRGIPVATVAVDGAMNAALLAVQMLAIDDADLTAQLLRH